MSDPVAKAAQVDGDDSPLDGEEPFEIKVVKVDTQGVLLQPKTY
jgi:hypothetical protein